MEVCLASVDMWMCCLASGLLVVNLRFACGWNAVVLDLILMFAGWWVGCLLWFVDLGLYWC